MRRIRVGKQPFKIIAAAAGGQGGTIGVNNKLPWKLPEDLNHFRNQTLNGTVIMGRKTYESMGKPLGLRSNIVVTRSRDFAVPSGTLVANSLEKALDLAEASMLNDPRDIWVIGGADIYKRAIHSSRCESIELTNVSKPCPPGDAHFPSIPKHFELVDRMELSPDATVERWYNPHISWDESEESGYLETLQDVLQSGELIGDRTGVGVIQKFGVSLRFDLRHGHIPLMTSKKVHWKSIVEEILQFSRGDINANHLSEKGVRIWEGHTSRDHLDSIGGTHVEAGSMWKAYGWQWRRWGLPYLGIDAPYDEICTRVRETIPNGADRQQAMEMYEKLYPEVDWQSIRVHDQLQTVVDALRNEPTSRRIVLSAWNVGDLDEMCLPPCHMLYTFNVSAKGYLNCQMTQRSWDLFLGAPFNIAGTALLVHLLATTTGLKPGEIKIDAANAHIYSNHVEQVKKQLEQAEKGLFRFPKLKIIPMIETLQDWQYLRRMDLPLENYRSHPGIKAPMAV